MTRPPRAAETEPEIGGIVLAAGEGKRFGGPKQVAVLDGRPLLEHAVRAMLAVPALDPVVVVARRPRRRASASRSTSRGVDVVVCDRWADGQSASLQAGVAALGEVEAAVVTLGDQPFISAEVIAGVLDHRGRHLAVRADLRRRARPPGAAGAAAARPRRSSSTATPARARCSSGDHVYTWEVGRLCDPTDIDTPRAPPGGPVMKLEQSFEVAAPIDQVWHALNDLERVAPCLPGAAITDHDDDGTYHGTFQVKLGPTTASYRGTIKIESADESTHTATLKARGTDKRGQGGANATIVNTLSEHDGGTTRRGGHRLHHHRPAGALRPRRHDGGHLEPADARLRDLPLLAPGRRPVRAQRRGGRQGRGAARGRGRRGPAGGRRHREPGGRRATAAAATTADASAGSAAGGQAGGRDRAVLLRAVGADQAPVRAGWVALVRSPLPLNAWLAASASSGVSLP